MITGGKPQKKRVSKKSKDDFRPVIEDILRSMADDNFERNAKRETLTKRTELNNMRQSISNLETHMLSQFSQFDHKLNSLKAIIDDTQKSINERNDHWDKELRSCIASVTDIHEKDKAKTLKTLQKLHSQHDADIKDTRAAVREVQKASLDSIQVLRDAMKSVAKEVSQNKDEIANM